MVLGGLQKTSFIDYPGKVSCVLFLSGCNFDCPYCHNPDLARGCAPRSHAPEGPRVFDFLEKRKGLLDGVVISGGEPTLAKDLLSLCEKIKELGYPVKLDTNGSRPHVMKHLMDEGLVDYIAMDLKTDPDLYPAYVQKDCNPKHILESIHTIMSSGVDYEFRTTCLRPLIDEARMERIARAINGARLYALQPFHQTDILHPEFFEGIQAAYGEDDLLRLRAIARPWVQECIVRPAPQISYS